MQLELDAPIVYEQGRGWWYQEDDNERFELPGLWLTARELQSLSLLLSLLGDFGPGLLSDELRPVECEIEKLLKVRGINPSVFRERVKVLPIAHRPVPGQQFQIVSEALLQERQVSIRYSSYNHQKSERDISPQTLIFYRENWYVDAWCHLREELRTFHLSRIESASMNKAKRQLVPAAELEQHFAESYGIFAGKSTHTVKLRFDRAIAREIACQQWHPAQAGEWDGRDYLLTFPYSDDRELVQDILRHVPNVYVEAPVALRRKVQNRLQDGLGRFVGGVVTV